MATATRLKKLTFEDFCAIIRDHEKADLIDGVIYMASPDNTEAGELNVWLLWLVSGFDEVMELGGKVYASRIACRLDKWNGPEPDLLYVRKGILRRVLRGYIAGAPSIAVEIVSRESIERDYVKKRDLHERARIPEYWIIDEVEHRTLFLRLDRKGKYREVPLKDGVFHSKALPGFWLRVDWLWQQPLPKKMATLNEILGQ